jgi:hypothetical protein
MKTRAFALLLLLPSFAYCGSFNYDLYEVTQNGRTLLDSKSIEYQLLVPTIGGVDSLKDHVGRKVSLGNGYSVGCSDYGEKSPGGFGCWLVRNRSTVSNDQYEGFSWEWYDHGMGSLYSKRQGNGRISLKVVPLGGKFAFQKINFLDDATFRLNIEPPGGSDQSTHEMVIKAGSELPLLQEPPR